MLSVVICTYNPNVDILSPVLKALKIQSLPINNWELIIVDNNSSINSVQELEIAWHTDSKIVVEKNQGLAYARIRGVQEAKYELIVFIDDDNVADENYLQRCIEIQNSNNNLGIFGGKALPVFYKHQPPNWVVDFTGLLGCRDLGQNELRTQVVDNKVVAYPSFSPIGTGMCIRKTVFMLYVAEIRNDNFRQNLGRKGKALTSGEDNDIVITALKNGWQVAYFPQLLINHLIPEKRTSKKYLAAMNFAQNKSWVALLRFHKISSWNNIPKWTVPLRKIKAYFTYKAWQNEVNYIKWRGACGMFEGLAK